MITFKTLTKDELKKDYSTRLGFVFIGPVRSSDKAIENLCNTLVAHGITKEHPEFVVRIDDSITAFVYKDSFDGQHFFQYANVATQMGICRIQSLYEFFNNN